MSKYLGACGRLVMTEYVGPRLSDYNKEPWIRRAKIASSLLKAAYMFTNGHPHFTFYLSEVSADNVAVDANDTAKFVNLRKMIVVDKKAASKQNNSFFICKMKRYQNESMTFKLCYS